MKVKLAVGYLSFTVTLPMQIPLINILRERAHFSRERINYFCTPLTYRLNLGYYFGVKKGHLAVKSDLL